MNTIYRHTLTIGTQTYTVHPVYKDDMALDFQHESQQLFYRASLSGKMDFVGEDASRIIGAPFTTEYILTIESSVDCGLTWEVLHIAKFYQTDCTIDLDDLKVTVKPAVKDRYVKVLDGMEKEFNLIELAPVIEPVRMVKRGVLQIYGGGDTVITNIFGGMSWEQDFDMTDKDPLEYSFVQTNNKVEMTFQNPPAGLGGRFEGVRYQDGTFRLENNEGIYYVIHYNRGGWFTDVNRISDDETIWRAQGEGISELEFRRVGSIYETLTATSIETNIYARWLCDVAQVTLDGVVKNTNQLRTDDPSYGGNYHYALGYEMYTVIQSARTSTIPTQWGRKSQTEYFNTPDDNRHYVPIGRSLWVNYSFWYYEDSSDYYIEQQLRKTFTLRDSFPIWSVISVLLDKLETGITFEGSAIYSQFLYGVTNPVSNELNCMMNISPKSNIIVGEYGEPAMKAPITLSMVLGMLKKAFGCYWYIDDQNRMHIEHQSWFKNGGSYSMVPQVSIDLTTLEQPNTRKRWSFDRNQYSFDKEQMPARYQFTWMDDCTDVFLGKPIDIKSPYVQADKVEEISISNFSSDVDYMTIAPENCSKDGFALLMTKTNSLTGEKYLPIEYRGPASHLLVVQNWYASMTYIEDKFLTADLPSWHYWIDNVQYPSKGIQRGKRQQLQIPVGNTIPDMMRLIRTGLGDGQVDKMSINLASRVASTTLKYDTYATE